MPRTPTDAMPGKSATVLRLGGWSEKTMSLKVKIVVGNPSPGSRTRNVAERLVEALLEPGEYDLEIIELAERASELFDPSSDVVSAWNADVASSDLVVFATPTYKATYTGLLKAFLDRYGTRGLAGVTAIAVQTGGNLNHSIAVDQTFVPLLLELGAAVPGRGLFVPMDHADQLDSIVAEAAAEYAGNLGRLAGVSAAARH